MAKDAAYEDVAKTINRMMIAKGHDNDDYLGNNPKMWRVASDDDTKLKKNVHINMGFNVLPNDVDAIVADAKEALAGLFDEVEDIEFKTVDLRSGQHEIVIDAICVESNESEKKLSEEKEQERKKAEAIRQEELKKKVAEEEEAAKLAAFEREAEETVKKYLVKLAKCKEQEKLDEIFDEIEVLHDDKKISEGQFNRLFTIYTLAEDRIKKGIPDKDESLLLNLRYSGKIKKAVTEHELGELRRTIKQHFENGELNNEAFESLNKEIDGKLASRKNLFSLDAKVIDIKPRKGESKQDFISRFMSATKEEYPDQKQRLAVAYSYWRNR